MATAHMTHDFDAAPAPADERAEHAALALELRRVRFEADEVEAAVAAVMAEHTLVRDDVERWVSDAHRALAEEEEAARAVAADRVRSAHEQAALILSSALGSLPTPAPDEPTAAVAVPGSVPLAELLGALFAAAPARSAEARRAAGAGPGPRQQVRPRRGIGRFLYVDVILPIVAVLILFVILLAWIG